MKLFPRLAGALAALLLPLHAFAADTTLTPTGLVQIEVGASEDSWGDKLNANAATLNGLFDSGPALKVANGGTGATTLTGILKGNGASAFTAVTAPSGGIVGTTDTQTLTNKTLTGAALNGTLGATAPSTAVVTTLNTTGVATVDPNADGVTLIVKGASALLRVRSTNTPGIFIESRNRADSAYQSLGFRGSSFVWTDGGTTSATLSGAGALALTAGLSATTGTFSSNIDVTGTTRLRGEVLSSLGASNPAGGNSGGYAIQDAGGLSMTTVGAPAIALNRTTSDGQIVGFNRQAIGIGSISITTTAVAYNTTSDYRLKTNVKDAIPQASLDLIGRVRLRDFSWKSNGEPDRGVLAHELQAVKPTAVTGVKDGRDMQAVDYSKLVPDLIGAVQALKAANDSLAARVAALEARAR